MKKKSVWLQRTSTMFFDYTKEFAENFPDRKPSEINLREIGDFIDFFIESHFIITDCFLPIFQEKEI